MRHLPHLAATSVGPWCQSRTLCLSKFGAVQRHSSTITAPTRLDLPLIDRKWQRRWQDAAEKQTVSEPVGPKAYVLSMFPYPSGNLHIGHLRVYTIVDVLARFKRMQGHEVLCPMGWDAFGLPAENAAIERGVQPAEWSRKNVRNMKTQLMAMNGGFDWSREFMTCDPSFYKHTQRIFLLLHERGLAYQAESLVNFDPIDRTVLANEQVDADGFSWRSGAKVKKIMLKQWFLRVTKFKEALLNDLNYLGEDDLWPDRVLAMQRNWIGKSKGALIRFPVSSTTNDSIEETNVPIFTTRPDTLVGAQYLALSLVHPVVISLASRDQELQQFLEKSSALPPESKAGYQLPDLYVENPLSVLGNAPECVRKLLPVYVAPYVLQDYGEGAVMGVPGHDVRDNEFWKQHGGGTPIRVVIEPEPSPESVHLTKAGSVFTKPGILSKKYGYLSGMRSDEAAEKIVLDLIPYSLAEWSSNWRLRDWLISRQRYWGTPIPIVHCIKCGAVPVPVDELPVELPELDGSWFLKKGGNPLEIAEDWVKTVCPRCTGPARRETDTMDTFVDSSWYFMRFVDPHNTEEPFSPKAADAALPVDIYVGGIEHAILHLLYARFISKFLATTSLWPSGGSGNRGEPFKRLITQGMVHGKTYSDPKTGRFLKPNELDLSNPSIPKTIATGEDVTISYEKMSKSKHNGIDPTNFIDTYGADVTRAHMLFQAPVGQVLEWEEGRIIGIQRWFSKIWQIVVRVSQQHRDRIPLQKSPTSTDLPPVSTLTDVEMQLWLAVENTISSVTHSLSTTFALNTVISDLIKLTNALASTTVINPAILYHSTSALLRMLAPVAPAFTEECWEFLHASSACDSILAQSFPIPTAKVRAKSFSQPCAVQENGKLRFAVTIPNTPQEIQESKDPVELQSWVIAEIANTKEGKRWLASREGKQWKRVIVVKGGRTVNFVE